MLYKFYYYPGIIIIIIVIIIIIIIINCCYNLSLRLRQTANVRFKLKIQPSIPWPIENRYTCHKPISRKCFSCSVGWIRSWLMDSWLKRYSLKVRLFEILGTLRSNDETATRTSLKGDVSNGYNIVQTLQIVLWNEEMVGRSERNLCNCVKKPEKNSGLQQRCVAIKIVDANRPV